MRLRFIILGCLIILGLGLFSGTSSGARERNKDAGFSLLHKMQSALGGADRIAGIRDLDWTVKAITYDHGGRKIGNVTKRTRWIRPNYLRIDQVGPGDTYVLYFDGKTGWEILPDKAGVRKLAGSELDFARRYLWGFMLNLWTADRTGGYTISSPSANVVRFTHGDLFFDEKVNPSNHLPAATPTWTELQGVLFPATLVNSHPNDGSARGRTVDLHFNTHLNPRALAAVPHDLKPDLGN